MDEKEERGTRRPVPGMKVYGLMAGAGGYFVGEGDVEGLPIGGGFQVKYKGGYGELTCTYRDSDFGRIVFTDMEKAHDAAESMWDEKDRAAREDFAEQNTKPFGKI